MGGENETVRVNGWMSVMLQEVRLSFFLSFLSFFLLMHPNQLKQNICASNCIPDEAEAEAVDAVDDELLLEDMIGCSDFLPLLVLLLSQNVLYTANPPTMAPM